MQEMQETQVWFLDLAHPLEKGMATHSSILAWKTPWIEEPGTLQSMGSHKVRRDWAHTCQTEAQWKEVACLKSYACWTTGSSCLMESVQFSSVQLLFATPWIAACQASLSISNSRSLFMSIESVTPSSHLILCQPLLLLPPIPPSIRVFSNESTLHMRWPEYWSFSFRISPSNEHPGLICFRMSWLDLLAVQGTLKALLQKYS